MVLISGALIVFTVSGALMGRVVALEGTYGYLKLFNEALYLIVHNYVQPVELKTLMEGAYRGMLESLDPGNEYLSPDEYELALEGAPAGPAEVGLRLFKRRGHVVVVAAVAGSPAAEAGMRTGDVLFSIDGRPTRTMGVWEATRALEGQPGTSTTIVLNAADGTGRRSVTLKRAVIEATGPAGALIGVDVGVVRITGMEPGDARRLDHEIASLRARGARRLLLDLRGCVSDSIPEAVGMASLFVGDGTVLTVTDRYEGDKAYQADGRKLAWRGPLAVLVDEGTARTCEALAAALRDSLDAPVLGQKTWGIGKHHRLLPLRDGDGVILAVGRYRSPAGKEWQGSGIEPDLEIGGEVDDAGDPQRQEAVEYLRGLAAARQGAA